MHFRAFFARIITREGPHTVDDPSLSYHLHTKTSKFAIGAVLMQDQGKGLQPFAFKSCKVNLTKFWRMEHVRNTTVEHTQPTSERLSKFWLFVQTRFKVTRCVEDAKECLPSLKQSGWVCNYVKAFQTLVMQVLDMNNEDNFRVWRKASMWHYERS